MSMQRRDFFRTSAAWLLAAQIAPRLLAVATAKADRGPAMFFPEERIAALRQRIAGDAALRARWDRLRDEADRLMQRMDGPRAVTTEKYPVAGRDLRQMAFTVGLAWRVTGEERYARALRAAVMRCADYPEWTMTNTGGRTPPWRGDLWTAVFTVGSAAAREALGDYLAPAEHVQLGRRLIELGVEPLLADWVLPGSRIHALDSMGHNWWCVCTAGAGVGALAVLAEQPHARGWVADVDAALAGFFDYRGQVLHNKPANFDPAGAFYEGVNYTDYTLAEYLTYRLARTQRLPAEPPAPEPVLEGIPAFFWHASYPTSAGLRSLDFGDSRMTDDGRRAMRLLRLHGCAPALAASYLERVDPATSDPLALLYPAPGDGAAVAPLPTAVVYPATGWAMLRSSWADDATLLGVRCGPTWNHAHADAGSFVLWHAGRPLLIDSGMCAYARPEYTDYYRQSRAHNVVLFAGQGEPTEHVHDRGAKFPGRLETLIDGAGLKYLFADATGPMARYFSRNYRHWLWLEGVILVFDDLRAHEPGRCDWLLHHAGEARRDGNKIELVNGPATARVTLLHPADFTVREEVGLAPNEPDVSRTFLALSAREATRDQKFIVAVVPGGGPAEPELTTLDRPGVLGVRVRTPEWVTDVFLNLGADGSRMHLNSNLVVDGWETDAYLVAFTRRASEAGATVANTTRYFVAAASYLRRDGQTVLASFSKVTAAFRPAADLECHLHGQPWRDISLWSAVPPRSVRVNGQPVSFEHRAGERVVRIGNRHQTP